MGASAVTRIRRGFVHGPDGNIEYIEVGSGPPLVLLHGVAGSRRAFFRVVPLLAERYRVLVPELRGERTPDSRPRYETMVADLRALFQDGQAAD